MRGASVAQAASANPRRPGVNDAKSMALPLPDEIALNLMRLVMRFQQLGLTELIEAVQARGLGKGRNTRYIAT